MASPYSRMPRPLLALMERPGSARFLVMEGMLTDALKPARLSWTRTFWRGKTHGGGGGERGGENGVALPDPARLSGLLPWAGL